MEVFLSPEIRVRRLLCQGRWDIYVIRGPDRTSSLTISLLSSVKHRINAPQGLGRASHTHRQDVPLPHSPGHQGVHTLSPPPSSGHCAKSEKPRRASDSGHCGRAGVEGLGAPADGLGPPQRAGRGELTQKQSNL